MSAARRSASPNRVLAIVCIGIVLANLDLFIVNVALPDIARAFSSASLDDLSWILNGYAIAYAALLVFFGRLAERHRRNVSFLLGVGLFTAASAACAAAGSVQSLVAFRVIQAAGAALMTPTSLGLLLASFPPEGRASAVRTWTAIGGLGAALGPLVGGLLVAVDWRWIFLVNLPFGAAAMLLGWRMLPEVPGHDVPRPSVRAAALVTGGIGLATFAIVKVDAWGWASPRVAACAAVSTALLAVFVRHCRRSPNPFVDPALFRNRHFTGAVLVVAPFSAAFGGSLLSVVLYEQAVWNWSALRAGLSIAPGPMMVPLTALLVAGRLIRRFGPAAVIAMGLAFFTAGTVCWAMLLTPEPDVVGEVAGMLAIGIGVGLTIPTLMGVGLAALPPSAFATGSGVINMIRQAGIAIGVALLIALLGQPANPAARVAAFQFSWWVIALLTAACLIPTALCIRDPRGKPATARPAVDGAGAG